jgi:hypothetical protein
MALKKEAPSISLPEQPTSIKARTGIYVQRVFASKAISNPPL